MVVEGGPAGPVADAVAVVDDAVDEALGGLDEPEEDNYKTLPCSRKMRDEPAEGIFFA